MTNCIQNKVSIIIVIHNSLPSLQDSLSSLKSIQTIDYELVAIDNNSDDDSIMVVQKYFPDAVIIRNKKNIGFAAACNLGANRANGEYLLFHNPDLQIDADALWHLLEVYNQKENVGAVAGRMRFPDGSFQPTCRNFPTMSNILASRGSIFSILWNNNYRYTLPDYSDVTEVPAVAGTLIMIKKDVLLMIGGFDKRFFLFMEDTDLCLRLSQAGYKNYFVPLAGGVHLWGKGSRAGKLVRSWHHHLSVWKYFLKHHSGYVSLIILIVILGINFILRIFLPEPSAMKK